MFYAYNFISCTLYDWDNIFTQHKFSRNIKIFWIEAKTTVYKKKVSLLYRFFHSEDLTRLFDT